MDGSLTFTQLQNQIDNRRNGKSPYQIVTHGDKASFKIITVHHSSPLLQRGGRRHQQDRQSERSSGYEGERDSNVKLKNVNDESKWKTQT